jgi:hypothetical protein
MVVEIFMSLRFHVEARRPKPNPETSATLFSDPSKPIIVVSTSEWYEVGVHTILFYIHVKKLHEKALFKELLTI